MGNSQSGATARFSQAEALGELPGVTYKDTLGGGRFLKSSLCLTDDGQSVVAKVYPKESEATLVRVYEERLASIRTAFLSIDYPHVLPMQRIYESDRSVFLVRQYLFANLAQRISTRPFLTAIEKLWIARQLIQAVAQSHAAGVCHGDIKSANFLLTSWHWVFLADHAPYKPVYLPADDPADYSLFFDTDGRRTACIAPERFVDVGHGRPLPPAPHACTPAMDVFSLGCTLAELFLDGQALFTYSRLLAYRAGSFDPGPSLDRMPPGVQDLVAHMLQRDPAARAGAQAYLDGELGRRAFPAWMGDVVHPFFASMLRAPPDERVALACAELPAVHAQLAGSDLPDQTRGGLKPSRSNPTDPEPMPAPPQPGNAGSRGPLPPEPDFGSEGEGERPGRGALPGPKALLEEVQRMAGRLEQGGSAGNTEGRQGGDVAAAAASSEARGPGPGASQGASASHRRPGPGDAPSPPAQQWPGVAPAPAHPAQTLLCVLWCTLLRGARAQDARLTALCALRSAAAACGDDDVRLQRALPALVSAAAEHGAGVKGAALRGIVALLAEVRRVPAGDASVVLEYVLPSLSLLPRDPAPAVQVEHAGVLADLGLAALGLLESAAGPPQDAAPAAAALREALARAAAGVLAGSGAPEARVALLRTLGPLCAALGPREAADALLPPLLPLLAGGGGDAGARATRSALLRALPALGAALGPEAVASLLLPPLERLAGGADPGDAADALAALAALTQRGLLRRRALLAAARRACAQGCLRGPGAAARAAGVAFLAAAARQLSPPEAHALLVPAMAPYLACEPLDARDVTSLTRALREDTALCVPDATRPGAGAALARALVGRPPSASTLRASSGSLTEPARGGGAPRQGLGAAPGRATPGSSSASDLLASIASSLHAGASLPAPQPLSGSAGSLPLPSGAAASYCLALDSQFLHPDASLLSAALEQSVHSAGGNGHFVLGGSGGGRSHARGAAAAGSLLVPRARRVPRISDPLASALHMGSASAAQSPLVAYGNAMYGLDDSGSMGLPGTAESSGIQGAMQAALTTELSVEESASQMEAWAPRGALVAHFAEHQAGVNQLAVASSGLFFVSASSDGTTKVWDGRRLDRDVSFRSRLTYSGQGGKINAATTLPDSSSVVTGSSDGSVHLWRVDTVARSGGERFTGVTAQRQCSGEALGEALALAPWGHAAVLQSHARRGLSAWDLRAAEHAWALPFDPAQGVISCFVTDPASQNWVVTGSSRGVLCVWDLRFRLPVLSWQLGAGAGVDAMALALAPLPGERRGARGGGGGGASTGAPLLAVAAGEGEVGLWDCGEARCRQVLRCARSAGAAAPAGPRRSVHVVTGPRARGAGAAPEPGARPLGVGELAGGARPAAGVAALLPTPSVLLTGGGDRVIRAWDGAAPERSYAVCAPPVPGEGAGGLGGVVTHSYAARGGAGGASVEERAAPAPAPGESREERMAAAVAAETAAATCHAQAVSALARLDLRRAGGAASLLLSASRDGVIKAWR
ncbi:hypothetical protein ACKKBG_A09020 [Auxenochlorella protothecoides x Auxenochlorella symbiontica]